MSGFTLFKVNGNALEIDTAQLPDYLSTELGWALKKQQEQAISEAIQKPADFIAARKKNIDEMFGETGHIVKSYNDSLKDFSLAGLPYETAKEMALQRARRRYEEALQLEELKHPGYGRALGVQEAAREQLEERQEDKDMAIYKRIRREKKARKAAKK